MLPNNGAESVSGNTDDEIAIADGLIKGWDDIDSFDKLIGSWQGSSVIGRTFNNDTILCRENHYFQTLRS